MTWACKRKFVSVITGLATLVSSAVWSAPFTAFVAPTARASARFDSSGGSALHVTGTHPATDALVPSDVLTAVLFTLASDPTFTRLSTLLGAGSTLFYNPDDQPVGRVDGEWPDAGLLDAPGSVGGTSATGVGSFGPWDGFPGTDLSVRPSKSP